MMLILSKAYDWPVGYHVGLRLADYWRLEGITFGQTDFLHFAYGPAHENRMQGNDFVHSVMYRHGVTCASCHDVHGTDNYAQLRKPADKLNLVVSKTLSLGLTVENLFGQRSIQGSGRGVR